MASWFALEKLYRRNEDFSLYIFIPIIICRREKQFQFCIAWNQDGCVQMPKTSLWFDRMNTDMRLRPKGTRGQGHTVGRRIRKKTKKTPVMICHLKKKKFSFLHFSSGAGALTRAHVRCRRGTYRGGFWWQTFSWSYDPEWGRRHTVQVMRRVQGCTHTHAHTPTHTLKNQVHDFSLIFGQLPPPTFDIHRYLTHILI